jgi:hypothetical protein
MAPVGGRQVNQPGVLGGEHAGEGADAPDRTEKCIAVGEQVEDVGHAWRRRRGLRPLGHGLSFYVLGRLRGFAIRANRGFAAGSACLCMAATKYIINK